MIGGLQYLEMLSGNEFPVGFRTFCGFCWNYVVLQLVDTLHTVAFRF